MLERISVSPGSAAPGFVTPASDSGTCPSIRRCSCRHDLEARAASRQPRAASEEALAAPRAVPQAGRPCSQGYSLSSTLIATLAGMLSLPARSVTTTVKSQLVAAQLPVAHWKPLNGMVVVPKAKGGT